MRYKIIYLATIAIMLVVSIIATVGSPESDVRRYHQHLEKKNMEECTHSNIKFCTHLPIVSISTGGQKIPGVPILNEVGNAIAYEMGDNGETMIKVDIGIVDNKVSNNHITDNKDILASAMIRIRGNSSRRFDKSSYLIRFIDDKWDEQNSDSEYKEDKEETELKIKVMGMNEHDEWALYGPYLDKTLLRNYMWMNISAEIMGYAPNVRFCEVFIDEEYKGVYVLMETIARSDKRVNITGYENGNIETSYILKLDMFENSNRSIENFTYYTLNTEYATGISVLYPGRKSITPQVAEYIENDISRFEKALYSYDFKDKNHGYRAYIDVDSFVDYYILQEFLLNNDMCSRSTYLYKDIRGKLHMGPVWDFNNVLDNFIRLEMDGTGIHYNQRTWYEMLMRDEYFVEKVVTRYEKLRETYLNEKYLIDYIDDTVAYLGNAVDRNYSVWGYTFEREHQKPGISRRPVELNPTSFDEAIDELKKIIKVRGTWLDRHIEIMYQFCHESKNKQFLK